MSQIEFDTPSRPKSVHQSRLGTRCAPGRPADRAGDRPPSASSATASECPIRVRRLQIDEPADRAQRVVALARRTSAIASDGSASMTVSHEPASSRWSKIFARVEPKRVDEQRVELRAPSSARRAASRRVDAADPVRHLGELGELHDPGAPSGSRRRLSLPGQPRPSHRSYEPASASSTVVGQVRVALPSFAGQPGVPGDHVAHLAAAGDRELETRAEAVKRRRAGPEQAHSRRRSRDAERLVLVLRRLQRDVVAEPLRLLVRVGVAADVDQQARRSRSSARSSSSRPTCSPSRRAIRHWRRTCSIG